jgi:hypothetical protein
MWLPLYANSAVLWPQETYELNGFVSALLFIASSEEQHPLATANAGHSQTTSL